MSGGAGAYVKALSVRQPWAWLVVRGTKPVENRTWSTPHRGPLVIHASRTFDREGYAHLRMRWPSLDLPHRSSYRVGGIVGRVRLVDCVRSHDSPWFEGPWGWVLEDPEELPFRTFRGSLGLFDVPRRLLT